MTCNVLKQKLEQSQRSVKMSFWKSLWLDMQAMYWSKSWRKFRHLMSDLWDDRQCTEPKAGAKLDISCQDELRETLWNDRQCTEAKADGGKSDICCQAELRESLWDDRKCTETKSWMEESLESVVKMSSLLVYVHNGNKRLLPVKTTPLVWVLNKNEGFMALLFLYMYCMRLEKDKQMIYI